MRSFEVREPRVREQITSLKQMLAETDKGELEWAETGSEGVYTSIVGSNEALLERDEDGLIVLRFMTRDRPDWTVKLCQLAPGADPSEEEVSRDAFLALLFDRVEMRVNPGGGGNAMSSFLRGR